MASGDIHDRVGAVSTTLIAIASIHYNLPMTPITIGSLAGYLWLSPDVDTYSNPVRRWGRLKGIWGPLQAHTRHRGITHIPVLGALVIQAYLLLLFGAIAYFLGLSFWLWFTAGQVVQQLLHLACDYPWTAIAIAITGAAAYLLI